jgi:hypothetical protein
MPDSKVEKSQVIGFQDFADSFKSADPSSLFNKFDGILHTDDRTSFNLKIGNVKNGGPTSITVRFFDKQKLAEIKRLTNEGKYSPTDAFKEINTLIEKGRIIFEYKDTDGKLHAASSEEIVKALKVGNHRLIKKATNEVCEYMIAAPLKKEQFSQLAQVVDSTLKLSDVKQAKKIEDKGRPPEQMATQSSSVEEQTTSKAPAEQPKTPIAEAAAKPAPTKAAETEEKAKPAASTATSVEAAKPAPTAAPSQPANGKAAEPAKSPIKDALPKEETLTKAAPTATAAPIKQTLPENPKEVDPPQHDSADDEEVFSEILDEELDDKKEESKEPKEIANTQVKATPAAQAQPANAVKAEPSMTLTPEKKEEAKQKDAIKAADKASEKSKETPTEKPLPAKPSASEKPTDLPPTSQIEAP